MEHTVIVWSKLKVAKDGKFHYSIEDRIKLTDTDIEELALQKFKDIRYSLNDTKDYYAEIEETKH